MRADTLPPGVQGPGLRGLPRGTQVEVRITGIDEMTLDVHASLIERLDAAAPGRQRRDDGELEAAAPLTLAIDVARAPSRAASPPETLAARMRRLSTLQIAFLVSVGIHGGLLFLRIAAPNTFNRIFQDTPLEVVLVNARSRAPTKAQVLAQASLAEWRRRRPGPCHLTLPPSPRAEVGDAAEVQRAQVTQLQEQQQQLLTQIRRELAVMPPARPAPRGTTQAERARPSAAANWSSCSPRSKARQQRERPARKRYVSPATREVVYAQYYDQLRRKIEERGR